MNAAYHCARAIRRTGGPMELLRRGGGEAIPLTGCIQPGPQGADTWSDPLGVGREERYTLYLPLGAPAAAPGDTILFRGRRYHVLHMEPRYLSGAPVYHRGTLRLQTGEP